MEQLFQPEYSNLCGQTCVAMLVGVQIEDVVELLGKSGCTRTADLVKALRHYSIECPDRVTRNQRGRKFTGDAILNYHWRGRSKGHWVLLLDGHQYDPARSYPGILTGGHVTSYLPFWRKS